jgi:hypothetical protein
MDRECNILEKDSRKEGQEPAKESIAIGISRFLGRRRLRLPFERKDLYPETELPIVKRKEGPGCSPPGFLFYLFSRGMVTLSAASFPVSYFGLVVFVSIFFLRKILFRLNRDLVCRIVPVLEAWLSPSDGGL